MEKLIIEVPAIRDLDPPQKQYERYPGFRIYPNFAAIKFGEPKVAISAIQVQCKLSNDKTTIIECPNESQTHIFTCYHGSRGEYFVREIAVDNDNPRNIKSEPFLCSHPFSIDDQNEWSIDLEFLNDNRMRYIVLFPGSAVK